MVKPLRVTHGLLQPLAAPDKPFRHITQDSSGVDSGTVPERYDNCLVTMCRFSKVMIATPCRSTLTAAEITRLWYRHVCPTTSFPDPIIVSDGDPLFMAKAWKDYIRNYLGATSLVTTPAHA